MTINELLRDMSASDALEMLLDQNTHFRKQIDELRADVERRRESDLRLAAALHLVAIRDLIAHDSIHVTCEVARVLFTLSVPDEPLRAIGQSVYRELREWGRRNPVTLPPATPITDCYVPSGTEEALQ
jgi:hypothetical protein